MPRISGSILLSLVLVAISSGCYSFIGRYGDPFYDGPDEQYFEKLVDRSSELILDLTI